MLISAIIALIGSVLYQSLIEVNARRHFELGVKNEMIMYQSLIEVNASL